jgi:hypothetical protein
MAACPNPFPPLVYDNCWVSAAGQAVVSNGQSCTTHTYSCNASASYTSTVCEPESSPPDGLHSSNSSSSTTPIPSGTPHPP